VTLYFLRKKIDLNDLLAVEKALNEIQINFEMNVNLDQKNKTILEKTAMTCPVFYSLHPDISKKITFNWL
jgi:uncharacterized OsmC-like protein